MFHCSSTNVRSWPLINKTSVHMNKQQSITGTSSIAQVTVDDRLGVCCTFSVLYSQQIKWPNFCMVYTATGYANVKKPDDI